MRFYLGFFNRLSFMSVKRGQSHESGRIRGSAAADVAAGRGGRLPAVAGPVAAAWHGEAAVCRPAWADVAAWHGGMGGGMGPALPYREGERPAAVASCAPADLANVPALFYKSV